MCIWDLFSRINCVILHFCEETYTLSSFSNKRVWWYRNLKSFFVGEKDPCILHIWYSIPYMAADDLATQGNHYALSRYSHLKSDPKVAAGYLSKVVWKYFRNTHYRNVEMTPLILKWPLNVTTAKQHSSHDHVCPHIIYFRQSVILWYNPIVVYGNILSWIYICTILRAGLPKFLSFNSPLREISIQHKYR